MKSFQALTRQGKARRLHRLALHALDQYGFEVAEVRLVGLFTNALFRVRTVQDGSYLMRVCTPGWRTELDLRSEVMWLQALSQEPDIGAPRPQPARNGDYIVQAGAEGVPEHRRCMLMSWIPGTSLANRLTEDNLFKMGVLFARLHEHGLRFSPPPGFTQRRMDELFARGEEDVLFSRGCREGFTLRERQVLDQTRAKVEGTLIELYADPAGLCVIHNDLWHGNIKVYRGRLYPLDFEDTVWGYPIQDIAMALQDLMVDVRPEEFEPLQRALRKGYESRAKWPESYAGQIDTFRAGRLLWVANYVARFEREHLTEHVNRLILQLERFLETNQLRKPGA